MVSKKKTIEKLKTPDRAMRMLHSAEVTIAAIEADLNRRVALLVEKAHHKAQTSLLCREAARAELQGWWNDNKPAGDDAPKFIELAFGRIGARAGKESVKLLASEEAVVTALMHPERHEYLTFHDPSIDQQRILKDGYTLDGLIAIEPGKDNFYADPDFETLKLARKKVA